MSISSVNLVTALPQGKYDDVTDDLTPKHHDSHRRRRQQNHATEFAAPTFEEFAHFAPSLIAVIFIATAQHFGGVG
jgi:hypothetical protein